MSTRAERNRKSQKARRAKYLSEQASTMDALRGHRHIDAEAADIHRAEFPNINPGSDHRTAEGYGLEAILLKSNPNQVYICKPGVDPREDEHSDSVPFVLQLREDRPWVGCATVGCDCEDGLVHLGPVCHRKGVQIAFYQEYPGTATIVCSVCDHAVETFELVYKKQTS